MSLSSEINPKIFKQAGDELSLADLNTCAFSPSHRTVLADMRPIDFDKDAAVARLVHNFSTYGFAVLAANPNTEAIISSAYASIQEFFLNAAYTDKKLLGSFADAAIDAKYNFASKSDRRPYEEIIGQRPFFYDEQYDPRWPASGKELKSASISLINELEIIAQNILSNLGSLYGGGPDLFKDVAYFSDQSTLRMIHCISDLEIQNNARVYGEPPADESEPSQTKSCVNIHTDWGPLTILPVASAGGLEFWYEDKEHADGRNSGWIETFFERSTILAMLGNVSDIISRGHLKAVPHRVRLAGEQDRFSLAYFVEIKSGVSLDSLKQQIQIPGVEQSAVSFYEQEARPIIGSELLSDAYLNFLIQK